jgi:signal transduction histidine kinase
MKLREKIILYFSSITIISIGLFFVFIYTLFSEYRQQEYQQRLKDKTVTTLVFLAEVREIDDEIVKKIDKYRINDMYQEKVLLFDERKNLIYSGIDDTKIYFSADILKKLSPKNPWIETLEDKFDVVGVYFRFQNKDYYGITKAYDYFGFSKLDYLKNVLIVTFIILSIVIMLISAYVAREISSPLNRMAVEISSIQTDTNTTVTVPDSKDEINFLARTFNDLMIRLNAAFAFQKHAVHHISHELKTPIAVLVSNFEKIERETDIGKIRLMMLTQKEDTKTLSDIINALLEISKTESGNPTSFSKVRIDDIIFDLIEELKILHPNFAFNVTLPSDMQNESSLMPMANRRLLTSALLNLMTNSVRYSDNNMADIQFSGTPTTVTINFINHGKTLKPAEQEFLFQHFFRGENSHGKGGFGLGLVLANKIIQLHRGTIGYQTPNDETNVMSVTLPLG